MGKDPFVHKPTPDTPDEKPAGWIVTFIILVIILAVFLAWAVYKWRVASKDPTKDARNIVYDQENTDASEPFAGRTSLNAYEQDNDL